MSGEIRDEPTQLFRPGFVYPSDYIGVYEDLDGVVVEVDELFDEAQSLKVRTKHGVFEAWSEGPMTRFEPELGDEAAIRVYRSGGGFYPDNRVTRLSRKGDRDGRKAAQ